jgi:glycosyltransferase involved in cell wall biosynthesis
VDNVPVVEDGSSDSTSKKASSAGASILKHIDNLGKGAATRTGIEYAISKGAKQIILLDADGQHEPREIPKFLKELKKNSIVFGARTKRKAMPSILKFGNWFINKAVHFLYGIDLLDTQCGYRAFRSTAYDKIKWQATDYSMESEMIANVGKKRLKYSQVMISTIYSDKYKGTTVIDGIKIVLNMLWWKITRW